MAGSFLPVPSMSIVLTPLEARVIGCLLEKEITTPEQYPLSLNALTNACNQKSNRDPVLDLDEVAVQRTVDQLVKRYLVAEQGGFGSRVAKYRHRFCNSEYGTLKFPPRELAIVCELLLRGPQTPGELRSRASRLCPLADVGEVEAALKALAGREDGPFVACLPREPGRRESRYTHLFGSEPLECGQADAVPASMAGREAAGGDDVAGLQRRLAELEAEVAELKRRFERLSAEAGGG